LFESRKVGANKNYSGLEREGERKKGRVGGKEETEKKNFWTGEQW